jgi:hypothetical protein
MLHCVKVHSWQCQQHHLAVWAVLSLGQQVCGNVRGVGTLICSIEKQQQCRSANKSS